MITRFAPAEKDSETSLAFSCLLPRQAEWRYFSLLPVLQWEEPIPGTATCFKVDYTQSSISPASAVATIISGLSEGIASVWLIYSTEVFVRNLPVYRAGTSFSFISIRYGAAMTWLPIRSSGFLPEIRDSSSIISASRLNCRRLPGKRTTGILQIFTEWISLSTLLKVRLPPQNVISFALLSCFQYVFRELTCFVGIKKKSNAFLSRKRILFIILLSTQLRSCRIGHSIM